MRMLDIGGPPPIGRLEVHPMINTASSAKRNLASADGTYELNGMSYIVRMGKPIPEGATFTPEPPGAAPTGPQAPDAQQASAALGEGYAAALKAAGFYLVKEDEVADEVQADRIIRLLESHGVVLNRANDAGADAEPTDDQGSAVEAGEQAAAKKPKRKPSDGPAENTDGVGPTEDTKAAGPSETS